MTVVNDAAVSNVVVAVPGDPHVRVAELTRLIEARDGELMRLRERVSAALRRAEAVEQRIEELNDAAIEWADDNDLCGQFERFCEAHGLRGRMHDVDVTVRATVSVTIPGVSVPRDADASDVSNAISTDRVEEALRDLVSASLDDWEVHDWG